MLLEKCGIDKIFLVNMKKSKHRRILMDYKLKAMNIDYEVIEGIDGSLRENSDNYNKYLDKFYKLDKKNIDNTHQYKINSPGAYGLLLTYKKIIEIAKKQNLKRILILEDDIVFHKDFYKLLDEYDKDLFTYNDVVWLGGNQSRFTPSMLNEMEEKKHYNVSKENYYWTYGTYSIILNNKILNLLDNDLKDIHNPYLLNIDLLIWNKIKTANLKGIVLYPNLIIPQLAESDNMGSRDIQKFAIKAKWNIDEYKFLNVTSQFKEIYNGIIYDNMSLRNSTINIDENISNQEISKLIENNNKSFVFIIPSYNNANRFKWNLDSVFKQKYPFWRIIYIDDASTDETSTLVKNYVNERGFQNKFQLIEKKTNTGQAHSRTLAYKECHNDEICCMLDGDDALFDDEMLLYKLNKLYIVNNLLISYGQFYYVVNNVLTKLSGISKYSQEDIENNNYRQKWVSQHLRTCEASLLKEIPEEYFIFQGDWLRCCTDLAEMWWVLEKSNGRHMNTGFPTYLYNKSASIESNYSYYNKDNKKYEKEKKYREDVIEYLATYKQSNKEIDLDHSAASANVVEINYTVNDNCEELLQFFQKAQENLSSALSYVENINLTKNETEKEKIKTILLDNQLNLITHAGIITNMLKKIQ